MSAPDFLHWAITFGLYPAKGGGGVTFPITMAQGGTNANNTAILGGIPYSSSTQILLSNAPTADNQILLGKVAGKPVFSTVTFPATVGVNNMLYASSSNVLAALSPVNNSVMTTTSGGVPTWIAALASAILITSGAGVPSLSQALPAAVQIAVGSFDHGTAASGTTALFGDGTWKVPIAGSTPIVPGTGTNSAIGGDETLLASGNDSFAFGSAGSGTRGAIGNNSFVWGVNPNAAANFGWAVGNQATATNAGSMVWGDSNATPVSDFATNQWVQTFAGGYYWNINNTPTLAVQIDTLGNFTTALGLAELGTTYLTPTTGFTQTLSLTSHLTNLNPAGTLASGTINLPTSAKNGQRLKVSTTQTITSLTVGSAGSDTVLAPPATLLASDSFEYIYRLSNTTWYPYEGTGQSLPTANFFVGNSSDVPVAVPMSGDASLSSAGVLHVLGLSNVQVPAVSLYGNPTGSIAGGSYITLGAGLAFSGTTLVNTALGGSTTLTGDVTGTGSSTIATTLATVNSNVGTFQGLTLDGKGRVTGAANQLYTRQYVLQAVTLTTDNLTGTYSNGTAGVGATFTYTATGAQTIDGNTVTLGLNYLLKDFSTHAQNGIYTCTTAPATGVQGVMTRATDYNTPTLIGAVSSIISSGGSQAGFIFFQALVPTSTIGVSPISYFKYAPVQQLGGAPTAGSAAVWASAGILTNTNLISNINALQGVTNGSAATSGNVGELIKSIIPASSAVPIASSGVDFAVTSITLSAGDWDIWGNIFYTAGGGTTSQFYASINTVNTSRPDNSLVGVLVNTVLGSSGINAPMQSVSITTSTVYYLMGNAVYSGASDTACGGIYARRVR